MPLNKCDAYFEIAKSDNTYFDKIDSACIDSTLLKIVKWEFDTNIRHPKKTAAKIRSADYKFQGLIYASKHDSRDDLLKLKKAIIDAQDLSISYKIQHLIELGQRNVEVLDELKELAASATTPNNLCDALIGVAHFDPLHDFAKVKQAVANADVESSRMYERILFAEAQYNFESVSENIDFISASVVQDDVYSKLAILKAKSHLFEEAKAFTHKIVDTLFRTRIFIQIGEANVNDSFMEAKEIILQTVNPGDKAALLLELAKVYSARAKKIWL